MSYHVNLKRLAAAAVFAAAGLAAAGAALAAGSFNGPVEARVLSVLDGDTFVAEAHVWPGQFVRVNVRIRGVDAPEMKGRCALERQAARQARDVLSLMLGDDPVVISNIGGAKYYGRVLADVFTAGGEEVSRVLLAEGLVRPYGGGKRKGWCG
ncbi:thermonuclease family protein [Mesorhizobium sp. LHD-90]|uniref:thermonuclease family protein n=1 Tax=Mesorhizobium sp. LHD-90 TaxID=3071414 RepID=UPI0027E1C42B|nr:thermonuclease family protein [Mesorhizobium sp. LHD-90]MDQ6437765.1 thermonuclease family protein [Mesorhizobium sp. LHD-90]